MAQQMITPRSHIQCIGADRSRCGYCHSQNSSHNFGAWAYNLDVRDYQAMLDAGWRRSGNYLYRPYMATTCCPSYVIRLNAMEYRPSSTHKRVLKRLKRFVEKAEENTRKDVGEEEGDIMFTGQTEDAEGMEGEATNTAKDFKPAGIGAMLWRDALGQEGGGVGELNDKEKLQVAVGRALDDTVADGTLKRDIVEAIRKKVKVYPSRIGAGKKKLRAVDGGGNQDCRPAVGAHSKEGQFASNAALLIAATERKRNTQTCRDKREEGGGENERATAGRGKKRGLGEKELERQMEIASVITKALVLRLGELWCVSVSSPGFVNLERKTGEMEISEMEREIRRSVKKRQSGIGTPIRDLNNDRKKKKEAISAGLAASSTRLSRIGSEVSADKGTDAIEETELVAPRVLASSQREPEEGSVARPRAEKILDDLCEGDAFTMELVPAQFMSDAFEVFRKYQIAIHQEEPHECTEDTYRRFLVDSPLVQHQSASDPEQVYGSFHMLYRVRGRLFAVGVVDILPRCLSSVYLFYDPDFAKLSPGTLSALKEIEWIRQSTVIYPDLQFYYMGYYIHSCPKMRYKAGYHPSELLCEKTRLWVAVGEAQKVLDNSTLQFTRLAPPDAAPGADLTNFLVSEAEEEMLIGQAHVRIELEKDGTHFATVQSLGEGFLSMFPRQMHALRKKVRTFIGLVGKEASPHFSHSWF
eukprot:GFKZ01008500.1.p1 GENE.GFKZ01008500.1~~GFKZ01008500.1.p1  ORF type:complete len:698 (-),score=106.90 GFKZ01008500.1:1314-3407(-)